MKEAICTVLIFTILLAFFVPAAAEEQPETFTHEELLAMDPELDTDGDGLSDAIEIVYEIDRFNADTDDDGVSDYTEFCITCTDVLVPDGDVDTDGDGLTNAQEGTYDTNPNDLDSDNDNLGDYDEIVIHLTDPLSKDSDGDGVYDGLGGEIERSAFLTTRVATYLGAAKEKLIYVAGLNLEMENKIEHPHYVESYYLLATLLEN